jgi:hypothetical protein
MDLIEEKDVPALACKLSQKAEKPAGQAEEQADRAERAPFVGMAIAHVNAAGLMRELTTPPQ